MRIIGMMSGTSADGVDAALVEIDDGRVTARHQSHFEPYQADERAAILANMGKWQASDGALAAIHNAHQRALAAMPEADLIGFHGQTFAHDPENGRSFQAGDPALLGAHVPVVYDFRADDIAAGGEGAPLIPIYHYALADELGFEAPIAFVNIGGVANVTYVDPSLRPEAALVAFDCGVGNALGDDLLRRRTGASFDENGAIAARGEVDQELLQSWLADPFFARAVPKSLDRDHFARILSDIDAISTENALATLNAFTAGGIMRAQSHFPKPVTRWIICGGGRKNAQIMKHLDREPIEAFGLDGDMIEAEGFAYLAWLRQNERPSSFPLTTGVKAPVIGGRIWQPKA